jgi:hypothetical protein
MCTSEPAPPRPHRGALVLGLGIAGFCLLIPGICAWVMGRRDLRAMANNEMDRSGEGMTQAGKVCGMISTILLGGAAALHAVTFVVLSVWYVAAHS